MLQATNMIPREEYLWKQNARIVTVELLEKYHDKDSQESFYNFMIGQTIMYYDGANIGFFVDDYERWLHGERNTD